MVSGKKEQKNAVTIKAEAAKGAISDRRLAEVSSQIDNVFEQLCFEMDKDEAKAHVRSMVMC